MLETSMMLMESFYGFENKYDYCIVGHSGDSAYIPFVDFGKPPKNRKQRLAILQKMLAHSQYCSSGDHTLEATQGVIKKAAKESEEDAYVFVLSDANLARYGIQPSWLGKALICEQSVDAHAIFLASFADEAESILRELPDGKGFVCLDTSKLPSLFKKIFTKSFASEQ